LQQARPILITIDGKIRPSSFDDNVANYQFALPTKLGPFIHVRTSNAIGMHHSDVGCDGAAGGWLQ
jgi:hypothetical protein